MNTKKFKRFKRAIKTRSIIKNCVIAKPRLCVHKTPKHIYAQIITSDGKVLASASTLVKEIRGQVKYTGNKDSAKVVGKMIAEKSIKSGVKEVAFDRSGFLYHGRIAALADAARESGLEF